MEKNDVKVENQRTSTETPTPIQDGMKPKGGMKTKSVRYSGDTIVWGGE